MGQCPRKNDKTRGRFHVPRVWSYGPDKIRTNGKNPENPPPPPQSDAQSDARDPDLATLITLWPTLPPDIRRRILTFAREG